MSGPEEILDPTRLYPRAPRAPRRDLTDPRDRRLAKANDKIITLVRELVALGLAADDLVRALADFEQAAEAAGIRAEE